MSNNSGESRPSRRVASVVLGGLAAGAVLGTVVAAEPALAADGGATVAAAAAPDAQPAPTQSLKDQFRGAFTPGILASSAIDAAMILIPEA